ncbi:hypothetical protein [Rhizobium freirei]|uniref:hypothetical protein n=1 Tax=Rhizobium freirei TaxID=1353277 RepID=UPI00039C8F26|nr:hypothetical protein [Rhizobium freirei]
MPCADDDLDLCLQTIPDEFNSEVIGRFVYLEPELPIDRLSMAFLPILSEFLNP